MNTKTLPIHSTGEWRRGTSPLRSLRYGREPLGSSGSNYPAVGLQTTLPSSQVPPIKWLPFESGWIIHPLRSRRITVLHRYYGVARPCAPHRYSHSCGSSTWVSPLPSERSRFSGIAHESLNQVHAASIPDAIQPVNRFHLNLSRDSETPRF